LIATAVWTAVNGKRASYEKLHRWFRLFLRLALASQMFEYGMTKVIPTQFPAPSLITLVTPVGNLSPQGMLWTSVGASTAYEVFTGLAELAGGILLLIPGATVWGAVICLADMLQVFALNVGYDIGVKQVSLHLIAISIFLLAPDIPRLWDLFVRGRLPVRFTGNRLFATPFANRLALAGQILLGIYLIGMQANANWNYWRLEGGGRTRSPLYGIWNVEEVSLNGEIRPAALNDYDRRWRRVIFETPERMVFQRTDDSFARYNAAIDVGKETIVMTKPASRTWKTDWKYSRQGSDRLILDGHMDGYDVHVVATLVDLNTFPLRDKGPHWIRQDAPR
ncbi:MAG TPA: DoxX family protein, partial [Terriglobia bacterium]|nr:DoxX family protein [Terriglobia bacterium]